MNQNDNNPKFTRAVYNFNVTENNPPGQIIGAINATDADGDVLSYIWDNKSMDYISMNIIQMSRDMRFPTMVHVLPAKAQNSLRICTV